MRSQCTYRCVVLPDALAWLINGAVVMSQCTYRCVVLPDGLYVRKTIGLGRSQCTYRCVVLPDTGAMVIIAMIAICLNAPTGAWCSLTGERGAAMAADDMVSMHLQVRGAP